LSVLLDTPFERWIDVLLLPRCCKSNARALKQLVSARVGGNDSVASTYTERMFWSLCSRQQQHRFDADAYTHTTFIFTTVNL
jgi:hypothetical protein